MSDTNGPVMIAATNILKPPPARIGQLGSSITLPRTIPIKNLTYGSVGASVGVLIGAVFGAFQAVLIGALVCGFFGVLLVAWQPVKGETLLEFLMARVTGRARQRRLAHDGERVAVYVGVARLHRVCQGRVRLRAGAIEVDPDQVDERGVLRSAENRNELPLRPVFRQRPRFVPLYDADLPEEMLRATGANAVLPPRTGGLPGLAPERAPLAPVRVPKSRTSGDEGVR